MEAIRLDGTKLSKELQFEYTNTVAKLKIKGLVPKLVVVTVGDDPASKVYVGQKQKKSQAVGLEFEWITLEEKTTETELLEVIEALNEDSAVSGFIVQFPLPKHINTNIVTEAISPHKDVDGFHPYNIGKLVENDTLLIPCTPRGIIRLLDHYKIDIQGKNATVVGRSQIVGMPVATLLTHRNATVTITHSKTRDLNEHLAKSDIVVVATGNPHMIHGEQLKDGAVVIDVGINRLASGKLVGDVDYDSAINKVSAITPVPGGVGPMTVTMLIEQTIICACLQHQLNPQDYLPSETL